MIANNQHMVEEQIQTILGLLAKFSDLYNKAADFLANAELTDDDWVISAGGLPEGPWLWHREGKLMRNATTNFSEVTVLSKKDAIAVARRIMSFGCPPQFVEVTPYKFIDAIAANKQMHLEMIGQLKSEIATLQTTHHKGGAK